MRNFSFNPIFELNNLPQLTFAAVAFGCQTVADLCISHDTAAGGPTIEYENERHKTKKKLSGKCAVSFVFASLLLSPRRLLAT